MKTIFKKLSTKHKNNKFWYYFKNFVRQLFPGIIYQSRLVKKLATLKDFDIDYIRKRVNYYNKLDEKIILTDEVKSLSDFKNRKKHRTYFFDSFEFTRFFSPNLRADFKFGDVTFVPQEPSIVKSRPINGNNANSVVLNLDKVRHFTFTKDKKDFRKKKNMLVGRNYGNQAHRVRFLEMYINHPLCNVGKVDKTPKYLHLRKELLTIEEQLDYKFVICLEGNDVATNLKWVMSSQSLAVMPIPKYETWFMEGSLIPNHHYVLIKDDYSDLEERMEYYINHIDEALEIINNAHQYIKQFRNKRQEDLISLLVLEKYFYKTGQKEISENLKLALSPDDKN
jgi:hypothetical protein